MSPTYTHVADVAPDPLGRQVAVTALGGTQTNVRTSTPSDPFTIAWWKPKTFKVLGVANPATGVIAASGKNVWKFISRKGVIPAAGQIPQIMVVTTSFEVPAGAEVYDAVNVRAALSAHFGAIAQQSSAFGDSLVTGVQ